MAGPFNRFRDGAPLLAEQRRRALEHHCRLATETMHPRFAFAYGGGLVLLTVNSGYE